MAGNGGGIKIRIAFIITRAGELGGAQVHVRDLVKALVDQAEEITVLAGEGGILFKQLEVCKAACHRLTRMVHPISPLNDLAAYLEIRSRLKALRPDLVTTHSNKAGLLGRLAARSLNIPVIYTSHGFLFSDNPFGLTGRFFRLMEKIAARLGDRVIVVAESEYKIAARLNVINTKKMVVIHNGLPDAEPGEQASAEDGSPGLIMVARFTAPKDHHTLLYALSGLQGLPWTLKLIGDGPGRSRAEALAGELNIDKRVSFLGERDDVPEQLTGSQIFVLSSKREGFPISILEAMRAGLPVVSSNVGGISEAVTDRKTGLLFPAGDIEVMREKLEELIADPEKRRMMGQAGRERFLEKFTIDKMVGKTAAVYAEVIANHHINGG